MRNFKEILSEIISDMDSIGGSSKEQIESDEIQILIIKDKLNSLEKRMMIEQQYKSELILATLENVMNQEIYFYRKGEIISKLEFLEMCLKLWEDLI